jgi:hypothetical protein
MRAYLSRVRMHVLEYMISQSREPIKIPDGYPHQKRVLGIFNDLTCNKYDLAPDEQRFLKKMH